jgi:hypothetical protein
MKIRPWFLPLLVAFSLATVYVLPHADDMAESAAIIELPSRDGVWIYEPSAATEAEINTLGKETRFSKATCYRPRPGEYDQEGRMVPDIIDVSIVLSGSDLNTSIHRPERCMPAQGHSIWSATRVPFRLEDGHSFSVKRLLSVKKIPPREKGAEPITLHCITYYFFIGRNRITDDHLQRTIIDMKDRFFHGTDQRWAYASATMMYGSLPWMQGKSISLEEADATLREFLSGFASRQIRWSEMSP